MKPTFGYAKQGAGRGYSGVKGLNVLLGTISTASSRPVIAAVRLRKSPTNSAKGAHRLVADTLVTAKACGATGVLVLRTDSAFYSSDVTAAVLRHKACFSITARRLPPVRKAIAGIAEEAWVPIKYTNAVYDEASQRWISEAEVAEIGFTAFTSKAKSKQVSARLIVRRVPDVNPDNQNPLFVVYRYHAVFRNSPLPMLEAEKAHRGHAIVEQVIADLKNGPLAHLPSGLLGQQCLGCLRHDGLQPHPRCRRARLTVPHQSHRRHPPGPAHQRPHPARPLRTSTRAAPASRLAMGNSLDPARRQRPARTTARGLTHPPRPPKDRPQHHVETAGQPGPTSTP